MKYVAVIFGILIMQFSFGQEKVLVIKDNLDYDQMYSGKEGMFRGKKNKRFGFINTAGIEVIPATYMDAKDFLMAVVQPANAL